ncbi:DUF1574 family protein [Nostoc sp.]|uniref:DUF1574 family protein n=1 Tax=Nostoc sp. TaxID=1180 RepID=UPI0035940CBC
MAKNFSLINTRISWMIAIIFLGTWLCAELFLAGWGDSNLPIQRAIHGYTLTSDILFMGNSRVAAGIKPGVITQASNKSLGYPVSSYNLGVGSTPFGIHYLLFKHLVKQGKQPKTLIYGFVDNDLTDTIFFDDAYLAQVSRTEDFPLLFEKSLLTIDSRSDLVVKKISRVYRYRFLLREVLGKVLKNSQIKASKINNNAGGFEDFRNIVRKEAVTQLIISEEIRYKELYSNPKLWAFEPSKTYLQDFIRLASQAKVKVIFVEMPITHLHNQMAQKSFYRKEYFEQLRRYLINYGIPLYNLSEMESDNQIPDTMHLSDEGATSFTQILFNKVIRPQI